MADEFPTGLFGFLSQDVDIERQVIEGGEALSGDVDVVATDGGGRVFAEFDDGSLVDRNVVLAWRALLGKLEGGVVPMVVPFCDLRHQPYGTEHHVTYGDGATHADGSLFVGGGSFAEATAAAALRATTLEINGAFGQPLLGGEWFSIEHPTKGWRAYKVRGIDGATLSFSPPLREAVAEGETLDFTKPRCIMRQDGRASARLDYKRSTKAAIRFVEAR